MKKMYDAVERFCARHPRFGIPNLMRYIVIGNVVVYFLSMLSRNTDAAALDFLAFNLNSLLHGEIWRIVTYIFVPGYSSPFALLIALYFYYWIGSTLEREWGTPKFTLFGRCGADGGGRDPHQPYQRQPLSDPGGDGVCESVYVFGFCGAVSGYDGAAVLHHSH